MESGEVGRFRVWVGILVNLGLEKGQMDFEAMRGTLGILERSSREGGGKNVEEVLENITRVV